MSEILENWVNQMVEKNKFQKPTIGGEEYLVIHEESLRKCDEEEIINLRYRIPMRDFHEMFGSIFKETFYDRSPEEIAKYLKERTGSSSESRDEQDQVDWGYDRIIDSWEERGCLKFRRNGVEN